MTGERLQQSAFSERSKLRAIETPGFPFEQLSEIAELESWRKEINRPIYHIHKWWAQRLGSVFRGILIGTLSPQETDVIKAFYEPTRFPGVVVFDPFMGSGTTIGEALKLGARAVGQDINPVSYFLVHNAFTKHSPEKVIETFKAIEREIAPSIQHYYQALLPNGERVTVLYYFWVKVVACPSCNARVDLFPSYIFAQNAYPRRYPGAWSVCPRCGHICNIRYDADQATCDGCQAKFNPQEGPAKRTMAHCSSCGHAFPIARAYKERGQPPDHRLYAKLVVRATGAKEYLPADEHDHALYEEAAKALSQRKDPYPLERIEPGYNTDQVLNYAYTYWHQMFNARQLLCLSLLAERIRAIPDETTRELFACLFSGTLEFNNMFASYKGEGTGAVRHMFSHHILKPERTPIEANLWGTPKSSGAFSTLFRNRVLRSLRYCENPFEIRGAKRNGRNTSEKVFDLSMPLGHQPADSFEDFALGKELSLSCGDSSQTDLPEGIVDAIVTDPPFFDNVHYSQLADFFYVWQRYILGSMGYSRSTTRSDAEVQETNAGLFTERLSRVLTEGQRVLKREGLLVFTYHHSRPEGWRCVLEAVGKAGFTIVAAHPIKSELSAATPKHAAKEPIDLDVVLVCRKRQTTSLVAAAGPRLLQEAQQEANQQIERLRVSGRILSRNDVRVILVSQLIKRLSQIESLEAGLKYLEAWQGEVESLIEELHHFVVNESSPDRNNHQATTQPSLF